jgi:two-component system response regulator YesN
MYKLMLVDDHKIILDGIESMIRSFDVAFGRFVHAVNGEQALALLEQERPDAMITDIRMPGMDGLTLCQHIRSRGDALAEIPIILLTGYDEFEYARKGIEVRAAFYLLKPVEKEELFTALKTVELLLDKQTRPALYRYSVAPDIIIRAVNGQRCREPLLGPLILCHFLPLKGAVFSHETVLDIKNLFGQTLRSFYARQTEVYVLAQFEQTLCIAPQLAQRMQINVSAVLEGPDELRGAVHQLYILQMKRSGRQSAGLWTYHDMVARIAHQPQPEPAVIKSIVCAMEEQNAGALEQTLSAAIVQAERLCSGREELAAWYSSLCMGVYKYFYDRLTQAELIEAFNYLLYSEILLAKENTPKDMAAFLKEHLFLIISLMRQNDGKNLVDQAKQLLQMQPGKTQREIAQALHVSSPYLSKIFHEQTGETFSQYSIGQRIALAKDYLKTTDWTVEKIGEEVGYTSQKHFYQVFKRAVKMSPAQYRKRFRVRLP